MSAVTDVPVALLGYGTVGSAVHRLLLENGENIERATRHRLRVVRALVREPGTERGFHPDAGILTTDFREVLDDPRVAVVAEVMGGVEPKGDHVLQLLRPGRPVVSANKQLIARRGSELFGSRPRRASSSDSRRPSVRRSRWSRCSASRSRSRACTASSASSTARPTSSSRRWREARRTRTRWSKRSVSGTQRRTRPTTSRAPTRQPRWRYWRRSPSARVALDDVSTTGIESLSQLHVEAARELEMTLRLIGTATLADGCYGVRVQPSFVDRHHPLAAVEGAFNAVMLQGDAIREITLEGPGAGGLRQLRRSSPI